MHAYTAARELGWPVLPSYGLTECCSQVATARGSAPELLILDHMEVRSDEAGRLMIQGASLLTGYIDREGELTDPRREGWFLTSDLGHVQGRVLTIDGRADDLVKIGGELVNVSRLEALLDTLRGAQDAALVVMGDERLGAVMHAAIAGDHPQALVEAFNARVHPFERIRQMHRVVAVPRSALGKVRRSELKRLVGEMMEKAPKVPE